MLDGLFEPFFFEYKYVPLVISRHQTQRSPSSKSQARAKLPSVAQDSVAMSTTTTDPTPVTFTYNIAFTAPVNSPTSAPHLSASELWTGIKRGGRNPHDFAEYVSDCIVLSGDAHNFRRRLVLADGAVHTASGVMLDQDVHIADKLHVWTPIYFSQF